MIHKHISKEKLRSADERGKRIRYVREQLLAITREEFCQNGDFTSQALKGWELGWGGGLTQQGANKIVNTCKHLNIYCTDFWLLYGIGRPATLISHGLDLKLEEENHIAKELLLFRELANSVDAIVNDDAMLPHLNPGDYVGGIIVKDKNTALGKDCIIITENNEILVRFFQKGTKSPFFDLCALNKNCSMAIKRIKNVNVKFVAPIVWIRRVFKEY